MFRRMDSLSQSLEARMSPASGVSEEREAGGAASGSVRYSEVRSGAGDLSGPCRLGVVPCMPNLEQWGAMEGS